MKNRIIGFVVLLGSLISLSGCCFPEHEWEDIVLKEASCTEEGIKTRQCKNCSLSPDYFKTTIPALGHKEKSIPGEEATCTHQGLSEGSVCERCGETLVEQKIIPETSHTPIAIGAYLPPTCDDDGLSAKVVCEECGVTIEESKVIPALGHQFEYRETIQPTCTESGYTLYECAHCHDQERRDEVPALGHLTAIDERQEADCIHDGLTEGEHCERCGETIIEQQTIPHTDIHSPTTIAYIAPTCTEKGYQNQVICDVCGLILQEGEEIPASGHDLYVSKEAIPAGCLEDGQSAEISCRTCNQVIEESHVVQAYGSHQYAANIIPATCFVVGHTEYTCSECGDSYNADFTPKLIHTDQNNDNLCDYCAYHLISSVDDFYNIESDMGANYALTASLDFRDSPNMRGIGRHSEKLTHELTDEDLPFTGRFDGVSYPIYLPQYWWGDGLFVRNAGYISGLNIVSQGIAKPTKCAVAYVAWENTGLIEYCDVNGASNIFIETECTANSSNKNVVYDLDYRYSEYVYSNKGTIRHCSIHADSDIHFKVIATAMDNGGSILEGLSNFSSILNLEAHHGAFAVTNESTGTLDDCINHGNTSVYFEGIARTYYIDEAGIVVWKGNSTATVNANVYVATLAVTNDGKMVSCSAPTYTITATSSNKESTDACNAFIPTNTAHLHIYIYGDGTNEDFIAR